MSKFIPDMSPAFALAVGSVVLAGCSFMQPTAEPAVPVLPANTGYQTPAIVQMPATAPAPAASAAAPAASAPVDARLAPRAPVVRTRRSAPAPTPAPAPARPVPRMICEDSRGNEVTCPAPAPRR
jgi:hypothetical protein